jgi:hypothetical protein
MRDRETIEHEIEVKRDDLEAGVAQLKDVVLDKVNVKRRARRALEHGKDEAIEATARARGLARDRPEVVIAVIAGVVALIALGVAVQRRRHR